MDICQSCGRRKKDETNRKTRLFWRKEARRWMCGECCAHFDEFIEMGVEDEELEVLVEEFFSGP